MNGLKIKEKNLIPFFLSLNPPLGCAKNLEKTDVANQIVRMNLHGY